MSDAADVYEETRARITALVLDHPDSVDVMVPACPDWTVKDVVAHLAGLAGDWRSMNLGSYGSDAWTEAQVASRRSADLQSVLDEWQEHIAAVEPMLRDPGAAGLPAYMPQIVITDLAAHEQDLRGALGVPGGRDSEAVLIGLRSQIGGMRQHFAREGLPTLRIEATGVREWLVGLDEPVATLRGDVFELFRATGGRRTMDEVRAMDWDGDPEVFLPHFLPEPYSWPTRSIE